MSGIPRWAQITAELRRRIDHGDYASGFPGELALANEFEVSRGTIRMALQPLREQGLVHAGRGRPPIAQIDPASRYGAIYSFHELVEATGARQWNIVLAHELVRDRDVAARLEVAADAELFHLKRLRFADQAPIALDELFSPLTIVKPLLSVDFSETPFYQALQQLCGESIASGVEQIQATIAAPEIATLLRRRDALPLLVIERVTRGSAGYPLEYRRLAVDGDQFTITRPFGTRPQLDRLGRGQAGLAPVAPQPDRPRGSRGRDHLA